ncbi:MAG: ABC transporter ATP-binding protein [Candidatus Hatepunaea meridiana]|nr:ABC transporter ATP-binding protein [Candidatus Hatepunaea meridiana]
MKKSQNNENNSGFVWALFEAMRSYRKQLVIGLSAAVVASGVEVMSPMLLRSGINALQDARPVGWLYCFSGLIILVAIISGFFRYVMRLNVIGTSRLIESDIRKNFFSHILSLAPSFFDHNLTGDLMARATDDLDRVRMVIGPAVMMSVSTLLTLIFSAVMMFYLDVKLALMVLLLAPIVSGVVLSVSSKLHRVNLRQQQVYGKLESQVQENLAGFRVIKSFVREDYESTRFAETCQVYFKRSMDVVKVQSLFMPLLTMIIGTGVAGILWLGGQRVATGAIRLGDFIAFMSYLSLMTWPMVILGWITHLYQRGKASHKRLQDILTVESQFDDDSIVTDRVGADLSSPSLPISGHDESTPTIIYHNIHFRYAENEPDVFKGLDLTIPSGSTLAIVGRTGSGKSTLMRLLTRFYSPQTGKITIDDKKWDSLAIADLRQMIGYVDQTPFLFSATIRENMSFNNPDTSDEEIENAARIACFDSDAVSFPDGYDTLIGERGVTLSGGQQQRLTIARALLGNPLILVLDDALSAIDTQTEARIISNLNSELHNQTKIFVTHRLAVAERADQIIVLDSGVIAESGGHNELMKLDGIYAAMYRRQRLADELGAML